MYESGITVAFRRMININSDSPHSPADRSQKPVGGRSYGSGRLRLAIPSSS